MCRWLAYSGGAIPVEELVINPEMSLIDQSLSARWAESPTNGDGFGIGWYGRNGQPGRYRSTRPAWNDANLLDLALHIESPLFLAHVRRSTGTAVQQTNCHPFRYGRWLFVHNGLIHGFQQIKRKLALSIRPDLFAEIDGTTDSELMFFLAITFGLEAQPLEALQKMAGLVEQVGRAHGIEHPLQMSLGLVDGERLLAVRYSTEGKSRSLFYSNSIAAMRELYPDHPRLAAFPEDARAVVSEPLGSLGGLWVEVPDNSALEISGGEVRPFPFEPRPPPTPLDRS